MMALKEPLPVGSINSTRRSILQVYVHLLKCCKVFVANTFDKKVPTGVFATERCDFERQNERDITIRAALSGTSLFSRLHIAMPILLQFALALALFSVTWILWKICRFLVVGSPFDNIPGPPRESFLKGANPVL